MYGNIKQTKKVVVMLPVATKMFKTYKAFVV
jgi:hypothetical protein